MPMAPVRLLVGAGEVPSGKLAGRVGRGVKRDHADVGIRAKPGLVVCTKERGSRVLFPIFTWISAFDKRDQNEVHPPGTT